MTRAGTFGVRLPERASGLRLAHDMTDDPNTRCTQCGYEWKYSGHGEPKPVATCPECGNKTPTQNMDTEEPDA